MKNTEVTYEYAKQGSGVVRVCDVGNLRYGDFAQPIGNYRMAGRGFLCDESNDGCGWCIGSDGSAFNASFIRFEIAQSTLCRSDVMAVLCDIRGV